MTELTPKEKAKEIYFKMMEHSFGGDSEQAKQCALIAVEELILTHRHQYIISLGGYNSGVTVMYWESVKTEIEKL